MKFVFFGSIPDAVPSLQYLVDIFGKERIVVVTDRKYGLETEGSVLEFSLTKNIELKDLNEIEEGKKIYDYGFTYRFNKILRKSLIEKFRFGIINFHGGPLPEYRGSATHIFALLNEEKKFGPTFHFVDEGVDTGAIIEKELFDVTASDTGFDLFTRTVETGHRLFKKIIDRIKKGEVIIGEPQDPQKGNTYRVRDLLQFQDVDLFSLSEKDLIKRLRAFYHPRKTNLTTRIDNHLIEIRMKND